MTDLDMHWREKWRTGSGPYEEWQKTEGIPVVKGFLVDDLTTVPVEPWRRMGGLGTFLNLDGAGAGLDSYVCEIPPAGSLKPQKHLFEETIVILKGRGATSIWREDGVKQTFEWQEGSLFSPPINVWYQLFNGRGDQPVRYWAVTTAPLVFTLFRSADFVFNDRFEFTDRYTGEQDYFTASGKALTPRVWQTNFVSDVYNFKLNPYSERGAGGTNIKFELVNNTLMPHISQFPVGTYKKAHRHAPGAHIIILNGSGYTLLWPEGQPRTRVNWRKNSMFVPPDQWYHQHFNPGSEPARYLAISWPGMILSRTKGAGDVDQEEGGRQISYASESPEILKIFENELAASGLKPKPLETWRK